jgi:hypothetical protein
MTGQEAERRRHQSERDRAANHDPDMRRVMPWRVFLERNGLSKATGWRLRKSGKGPKVVQRSERLIGVTYADEAEWQARRTGA